MREDDYDFDEGTYTLIGRRGGKVYRLGDAITVTLAAVNKERCEIDFVPGTFETLADLAKFTAARPDSRKEKKRAVPKRTGSERKKLTFGGKAKRKKKSPKGKKRGKRGRR